jgi:S-adenosylhomocysteine hydrolase
MAAEGDRSFPAINVNDCVTKSKFGKAHGCSHPLSDGIIVLLMRRFAINGLPFMVTATSASAVPSDTRC